MEHDADQLFGSHGFPQIAEEEPRDVGEFIEFYTGNHMTVAVAGNVRPVGFSALRVAGADAWLGAMAVARSHGGKGIGAALLKSAIETACLMNCDAVWLSTFRAVPFNAPFYLRHGFVEISLADASSEMASKFHHEVPKDTDSSLRMLMRLSLR